MTNILTLADYLQILRRRLPLIAGVTFAAVAAAIVLSLITTPLYRASASILINQNSADDIYDPVTGIPFNQAERVAANELRLMQSTLVTNAVGEKLGLSVGGDPEDDVLVGARVESSADVLVSSATDADPERARLVAQTYAETYLEIRRDQFVSERLETAEKLSQRIRQADDEIAALQADGASETDIRREVALRDDLADSFDRLQITADLGTSGRGQIIDEAEFPTAPFTPQTTRNVAAAGVLGLLLGSAAALVLHSLDRSLKTREAVDAISGGIPILAAIPRIKGRTITPGASGQSEIELFRSMRASIEFASVDRPVQVLQVTSPGASAGKTTIAGNLAVVMAQSGKRVAVVDGDLRRPRLHAIFDLPQEPGLTSFLIRKTTAKQAVRLIDSGDGTRLRIMPSGPVPPGPSELLGSEQARRAFEELRSMVDIVIVDSAPVLPVSDALVLSRHTDATIVVANAASTSRSDLTSTLEQLDQAGATVIGIVLNHVKKRRGVIGYGYGSDYGYGSYGESGISDKRLFGRQNAAPRHAGTVMLDKSEVPEIVAARVSSSAAQPSNDNTLDQSSQSRARDTFGDDIQVGPTSAASPTTDRQNARAASKGTARYRPRDKAASNKGAADGTVPKVASDKVAPVASKPDARNRAAKNRDRPPRPLRQGSPLGREVLGPGWSDAEPASPSAATQTSKAGAKKNRPRPTSARPKPASDDPASDDPISDDPTSDDPISDDADSD